MKQEVERFTVQAARCKRCGGILLSEYGLKHGMGHVCKAKYEAEHAAPGPDQHAAPGPDQITFFEEDKDHGKSVSND